jgi:pyridoxal phosphate enzyme (YggS family)
MEIVGADPATAAQIRERHDRVLARLRSASRTNGHDPDRLRIVAVTKGHPLEVVRTAVAAGLTRFGENRVQEAEPKVAALPDADWHLVGHLQSNKARRAVTLFGTIHSIDSVDLLRRVAAIAAEESRAPRLLLQVNVSGELSKSGMKPEAIASADLAAAAHEAGIVGLMTIAPMGASVEEARDVFRRLWQLRERLRDATGLDLPELSMGMTADAEAAAAEGATLVRIGTAIFGPRR